MLLNAMEGRCLKVGRNMMTALSATIMRPNFKNFKFLYEWETKHGSGITSCIDDLNKLVIIENKRKKSFISYLCRKHRLTEGKN
jgi:hypothetical protein